MPREKASCSPTLKKSKVPSAPHYFTKRSSNSRAFSSILKPPSKSSKLRKTPRYSSAPAAPQLLVGIHALKAAVQRGYLFKKLYLQKERSHPENDFFIAYAKAHHLPFEFVPKTTLTKLSKGQAHQGFCAELKSAVREIASLPAFLKKRVSSKEPALLLLLDRITDQQNVGALSRSAYFFGCSAILCEKTHSAPIDQVVHKTSAGASLLVPYFFAEKLASTLQLLKTYGFLCLAAVAEEGPPVASSPPDSTAATRPFTALSDFHLPPNKNRVALMMGAEDRGIRPHLLRLSHHLITIEKTAALNSLNVSVAGGILLQVLAAQLKRAAR